MRRIMVLFALPLSLHAAETPSPLLEPWPGDFGGLPPFDRVKVAEFQPALESAIAQRLREISVIAENPEPPSFENTLEALEHSGRLLDRVSAVFDTYTANLATPEVQEVQKVMAPKRAALRDEIYQNAKLFRRIEAVYRSPGLAKRTPEQRRLAWSYYTRFVERGALVPEDKKPRVKEINQRLATLETQFEQNLLADEAGDFLLIESEAGLAGLPASVVDGAREEAARRKLDGKWLIRNTRSSMEPFLTYAKDRALREKGFRIWASRGDKGGEHDNNAIVTEILRLRAERSKLFGFPTYAHWRLANTMAKTPEAAMDLLLQVWKPAVARAREEVADMQKLVDQEGGGFRIQPWDYRYYAEKVRKARYDLDFDLVKPFLSLEKIREAMFYAAGRIHGLRFEPVRGVPVFHPTMTTYKVTDRSGKVRGLWYFDPFAREGKNSGAWMSSYREQDRLDGHTTLALVSNNSNFVAGKPGEPVTLSWDDAVTMFHEFGHALHGLSSDVTYPTLSGTSVLRDFVEFPSQVNEHYLETDEVLKRLTNREGKTIPKDLLKKIRAARTFNEGFATVEFLASGIVDMKLHLAGDARIDPRSFEKNTLAELGMPEEIIMRHRIPHFGHVFSGEGYAAGYYNYLWAGMLEHDAYAAFEEKGNPFDKALAKRLHNEIFAVGGTVDPAEAFRRFRGREPRVDALLRSKGFPVPGAAKRP